MLRITLWAIAVSLISLRARAQESATPAPSAISVPVSQYWDGIDGRWSTFGIQLGTPPQQIRVLPLNGQGAIWAVLPDGCTADDPATCDDDRGGLFLINRTSTWEQQGLYGLSLFAERPLRISGNGLYGHDAALLGWPGHNLPGVDLAVMAGIATKDFYIGGLPLNPWPVNFTSITQSTPSLMSQLRNQSKIPSLTYGYTAGYYRNVPPTYGSLTLGGFDRSRFVENNVSFTMGLDISYDLLVGIQSIDTGSTRLLTSPIFAFINSAIPTIWLPIAVCEAFEAAFGLIWDTEAELYLVSSDLHTRLQQDNPVVRFTIGPESTGQNVVIEMPYGAFDLEAQAPFAPNASLYFPLKRAENSTQYMLGRAFLQSAYITVNYEYFNFSVSQALYPGSGTAMDLVTLPRLGAVSPDDDSSSLSTGAIAGIAVGGAVVIIAIVAGIVWFCILKKQKKQQEPMNVGDTPLPLHEVADTQPRPEETYEKNQLDSEEIHETDGRVIGHELGPGFTPPSKPQGLVELPVNEVAAWEAQGNEATPYATPMTTPGVSPFSPEALRGLPPPRQRSYQ